MWPIREGANPKKLKQLGSHGEAAQLPFYTISAVTGEGIEALKFAIAAMVVEHRPVDVKLEAPAPVKLGPNYPPPPSSALDGEADHRRRMRLMVALSALLVQFFVPNERFYPDSNGSLSFRSAFLLPMKHRHPFLVCSLLCQQRCLPGADCRIQVGTARVRAFTFSAQCSASRAQVERESCRWVGFAGRLGLRGMDYQCGAANAFRAGIPIAWPYGRGTERLVEQCTKLNVSLQMAVYDPSAHDWRASKDYKGCTGKRMKISGNGIVPTPRIPAT